MTYISWSSDFLKFFRLGQFLCNCWSYSSDTWHLQTSKHSLLNAVIYFDLDCIPRSTDFVKFLHFGQLLSIYLSYSL